MILFFSSLIQLDVNGGYFSDFMIFFSGFVTGMWLVVSILQWKLFYLRKENIYAIGGGLSCFFFLSYIVGYLLFREGDFALQRFFLLVFTVINLFSFSVWLISFYVKRVYRQYLTLVFLKVLIVLSFFLLLFNIWQVEDSEEPLLNVFVSVLCAFSISLYFIWRMGKSSLALLSILILFNVTVSMSIVISINVKEVIERNFVFVFLFFGCLTVFNFLVVNLLSIKKINEERKKFKESTEQYLHFVNVYSRLLLEEKARNFNSDEDKERTDKLSYQLKNEFGLTDREVEVLFLLWNGLNTADISNELNITRNTTKFHKSNIFQKLDVNSTYEVLNLRGKLLYNID